MTRRSLLRLGLVFSLAIALIVLKVPLASSQGVTLVAARVSAALPVSDPDSNLWQQASALDVPLSAQNITRPWLLNTKVRSVTARALHNDEQIAFLLEWADDTQNDSLVRVQDFRDAVALQFPLVDGQPFLCMGQPGGNVNIWHWKADWQADITARKDMASLYPDMDVDQYPFTTAADPNLVGPADYTDPNYLPALASGNLFASAVHTTPVEDLIAGTFGSLTAQPEAGQNVQGSGGWAGGKWRVIFSRDLASKEPEDVSFTPGKVYSIALAAWDGANGERNGQKSTSQWVTLQIEGAAPAASASRPAQPAAPFDWLGMGFVFGPMVLVGLLILGLAGAVSLLSVFTRRE